MTVSLRYIDHSYKAHRAYVVFTTAVYIRTHASCFKAWQHPSISANLISFHAGGAVFVSLHFVCHLFSRNKFSRFDEKKITKEQVAVLL
jgi:hypothetical protein